ncbi:MAG: extracellular solute-binding protein [Anaerolineae bacterium]
MIRLTAGLTLVSTVMIALAVAGCGSIAPVAPPPPAPPQAASPAAPTVAPAVPTAAAPAPTAAQPIPATPATEPVTIAINCGCAQGGDGDNSYRWLTEVVAPLYEGKMRQQGKNVRLAVIQGIVDDEALKQQYALDIKSGRGADILAFDGFWTPEFVAAGLLKPLDELAGPDVNAWEGWQHIPEPLQRVMGYRGRRYGLAEGTDARVLWYRKDIFKEVGLPEPWQPKSWDDIFAAARLIKGKRPDVTPLQVIGGTVNGEATTMQGWYPLLLGAGANVYDFETNEYMGGGQAVVDALTFYKRLYVDEQLGDARLQLVKGGREQSQRDFRDGKIAIYAEGDYLWRAVLAEGDTALPNKTALIGWAPMPAMAPAKGIRGQDWVTVSGGTGYVMNPNTAHPAETWAALATMFSKEALDAFQTIEPRLRVRDDVPVPNDPVMTGLAQKILPLTTTRPADPAYPAVSLAIQQATESVIAGDKTPQEAAAAYEKRLIEIVGADRVERSAP